MLNRTLLNGVYIGRERNNGRKHYIDATMENVNDDGVPRYPLCMKYQPPWNLNALRNFGRPLWRLSLDWRSGPNMREDEKFRESLPKRAYKLVDQIWRAKKTNIANYARLHIRLGRGVALRKVTKLIKTAEISFSENRPRLHISRM